MKLKHALSFFTWILFVPTLFSITTGCVSSGKYKDLETAHSQLMANNTELETKLEASQNNLSEQSVLVSELTSRLGAASTDKKKLEASVNEMKQALSEAAQRKRAAEKTLHEYRELVRRFKGMTDAGQLKVKTVEGRMIVALNSDILFPSGSARLSEAGIDSLKEVARVLASLKGKKFQIEGHTDNVPVSTTSYPSNWELASARAIGVIKTMIAAGMPPERISAASFAEFRPAAPNETPEDRMANRRIEISFVPDLSLLPGFDELQEEAGLSPQPQREGEK
jgi:chemotaxis protein MotB